MHHLCEGMITSLENPYAILAATRYKSYPPLLYRKRAGPVSPATLDVGS